MILRLVLGAFLLSLAFVSNAQTSDNPFELKNRLVEQRVSQEENNLTPTNPFDKVAPQNYSSPEVPELPQLPTINPGNTLHKNAWFWLLLFMTLFVAIIINLNRTILLNLSKAWTNINFGNLLLRDKKGADQVQYISLGIIFYLNFATFLILAGQKLYQIPATWTNWLTVLGIIVLVYLTRHAVLGVLGSIFSVAKEAKQYSFTINLFNIINGMFLLMLNYFIAFGPDSVGNILIPIGIFLVAIQFIYRSIRGLLLSARFIGGDQVHFLLYLCTCEIAPFVVGAVYLSELT